MPYLYAVKFARNTPCYLSPFYSISLLYFLSSNKTSFLIDSFTWFYLLWSTILCRLQLSPLLIELLEKTCCRRCCCFCRRWNCWVYEEVCPGLDDKHSRKRWVPEKILLRRKCWDYFGYLILVEITRFVTMFCFFLFFVNRPMLHKQNKVLCLFSIKPMIEKNHLSLTAVGLGHL